MFDNANNNVNDNDVNININNELDDDNVVVINQQVADRLAKLQQLREQGNAYPNDFKRQNLAENLKNEYSSLDAEELHNSNIAVTIAGRMMTRRIMGKASFANIQDMSDTIQIYLRQGDIGDDLYENFKNWDLGDILGITGTVFKTKTGELSVKVENIRLLAKALRPMPEKFHGLVDAESRCRQRYLDLIANKDSRRVFQLRSKLITALRQFFNDNNFLEVETPMMQPLAGGASARPFVTHHNTFDIDLYLRIAPELFLKRLVVGGFERVYEVNRNFRNEGISVRHNPEFTMLEFYMAYADYHDLMDLTENLLRYLAQHVLGTTIVNYQDKAIDLSQPFKRMTVKEAILHYNQDISEVEIDDMVSARLIAQRLQIPIQDDYGLGKIQIEIFEKTAEKELQYPTFITAYPVEVSPLARKNDDNPFVTDRFEFFIGGHELANGFSELNDPEDQAQRFRHQAENHASGDLEAMRYDADYINALEYGLPPTAGEGIGIDRLIMFFANVSSIRDVILFPLMRLK